MLKWLTQINSLLIWQLWLRCTCVCLRARLEVKRAVVGSGGGGGVEWDTA